jgi:hypothetical protein
MRITKGVRQVPPKPGKEQSSGLPRAPKRTGRRQADRNARRNEICYECYMSGAKPLVALPLAVAEISKIQDAEPPKKWGHLRTYAKRHAEKNKLPVDRRPV